MGITRNAVIIVLTMVGALISLAVRADGIDEPIPSFYQEAGFALNHDYVNQHPSEQIDPFSGKLKLNYVDLFIPGNGGMDIKIQRSYHSVAETPEEPSAYGVGWTMNPARILRKSSVALCDFAQGSLVAPVLELADGSRQVLYTSLSGDSYISTNLWAATCIGGGTGLMVYAPDGTRYQIDIAGPAVGSGPSTRQNSYYVSQIIDRNGNTLNFTYSNFVTHMGISGITSSDGRTVTFTYSGSALQSISADSRTWNYTCPSVPNWTGGGYCNLTQVTRPDGASWGYQYNAYAPTGAAGGYSINQITYPTGGTVSYSYGYVYFAQSPDIPRSTVVMQKTAFDGTANYTWTYTYTPATQPCPVANGGCSYTITGGSIPYLDQTTISGPEGNHIYYHIGYGSATPGIVYSIGSLSGIVEGNTQITAFGYSYQKISNQANLRPGNSLIADPEIDRPLTVQKITNRNGQNYTTTFVAFDGYGNPTSISEQSTESQPRQTTRTYNINTTIWLINQVKDETIQAPGQDPSPTVTRTFDTSGNKLTESRNGVTTTFTYTPQGDMASKRDARTNTTTYSDYFRGIPRQELHPEGVTISRLVDLAGNVTSQTDGENATTTYGHDGLNRLTSIQHPLGNPVTVTWSATSRTVTRGAYQEIVTYDGFGRDKQIKHVDTGAGQTIVQNYLYDALGRRTFASYPNASVGTGFTFDIVGQPFTVYHVYDPVADTNQGGHGYYYAYNTVRLTNERGLNYTYTYRAYGDPDQRDLMQIASPEPGTDITMARNVLGGLTKVTQGSLSRTYGYDAHYFLVSKIDPEVGTTTLGRDAVGNLTSRQVSAAPPVQYGYDGLNRLTSITYASAPSVTKTYFKDDKIKTVDSSVAHRTYVYDANKNLTSETLALDGHTFAASYGYDGNDALSTLTYGSGSTIQYAPDAFGRPTKAAPYVTALSRHPTGQISSMTYGNGQVTTYAFNARNWPSGITIAKPGNGSIVDSSYGYDGLGNVQLINDSVWNYYVRNMTYDNIDRLKTIGGPWVGTSNGSIGYDGVGNIQSITLGASTTNYAYSATTNLLQGVSGAKTATYSYDPNGNVIGDGTNTFNYDDASTLQCAKCGAPDQVLYTYDGEKVRVKTQKNGATTYFMNDRGGHLLWEMTPGANAVEYFYLAGKQVATRQFGSVGQ